MPSPPMGQNGLAHPSAVEAKVSGESRDAHAFPIIILMTGSWWSLLLRGLAAMLFGILALSRPAISLQVLVLLFGVYVLLGGALAIAAAIPGRKDDHGWWVVLLEGAIGIVASLAALLVPQITTRVLLVLIASWAISTGVLEIAGAILLRKTIKGEWLLAFSGIISILFGVSSALLPGAGGLALVVIIGVYGVFFGALFIALAFRMRHAHGWVQEELHPLQSRSKESH